MHDRVERDRMIDDVDGHRPVPVPLVLAPILGILLENAAGHLPLVYLLTVRARDASGRNSGAE